MSERSAVIRGVVDETAMIDFAQALVRVPSVFDPARDLDESVVAELIGDRLRSFGWAPQFDLVEPGRPNVITVVDGRPARARR